MSSNVDSLHQDTSPCQPDGDDDSYLEPVKETNDNPHATDDPDYMKLVHEPLTLSITSPTQGVTWMEKYSKESAMPAPPGGSCGTESSTTTTSRRPHDESHMTRSQPLADLPLSHTGPALNPWQTSP
ncbi:hypothetical protein LSAT2_006015 [Lamellibrachia satsuma]|nr:hypothetical protein LSAT2_006015 [Lamellibrachia satsuma]